VQAQQQSFHFELSYGPEEIAAWYFIDCPGCGKQLSIGVNSHWAGCACGRWYNGVDKVWNKDKV
jgi:hypothetical protein